MSPLGENYNRIRERIAAAAARSGREAGSIRLLAVTKTVEARRIREALELGVRDIGENRIQEAESKVAGLADTGARWHLIGHLQSNKARRALELFDSIRSLDTPRLAARLDTILTRVFPVFIQVRSGEETTKSGVEVSALPDLVDAVRSSEWLRLEGLMAIPPYFENAEETRPYFRKVRKLAEVHQIEELSMGMSHDFEVAIEEGSTEVRIGTALFGARR